MRFQTSSTSQYAGLPVNLPTAAAERQPPSKSAAFSTHSDGKIATDKQEVPRDCVGEFLKRCLAVNPELLVIINTDERFGHGRVLEAIDQAPQNGESDEAEGRLQ